MKLTKGHQRMLDVLGEHGPMNAHDLAQLSHLAYRTLYNGRNLLPLQEAGLIYVESWQPQQGHGGEPTPAYTLGPGKSVPKPKPKSDAEKSKTKRDRKAEILSAAITVAAKPGGWSRLTRVDVAHQAGCAAGLVSKYFGTMTAFKRSIMRAAVTRADAELTQSAATGDIEVDANLLSIVAQGLASGDKSAQNACTRLKVVALNKLAG